MFYWGGLICWGKHKKKIITRGILYEQGINIYRIVLLLLSTVVLAPHRLFRQRIIIRGYCSRRDFAQKAKCRGGTLVTRSYIKESTLQLKYTHSQTVNIEKISICLNRGREESVGNGDVSIVCARKYEMVRMT